MNRSAWAAIYDPDNEYPYSQCWEVSGDWKDIQQLADAINGMCGRNIQFSVYTQSMTCVWSQQLPLADPRHVMNTINRIAHAMAKRFDVVLTKTRIHGSPTGVTSRCGRCKARSFTEVQNLH